MFLNKISIDTVSVYFIINVTEFFCIKNKYPRLFFIATADRLKDPPDGITVAFGSL